MPTDTSTSKKTKDDAINGAIKDAENAVRRICEKHIRDWVGLTDLAHSLNTLSKPATRASIEPNGRACAQGIPSQGRLMGLRLSSFSQHLLPIAAGAVAGLAIARLLRSK